MMRQDSRDILSRLFRMQDCKAQILGVTGNWKIGQCMLSACLVLLLLSFLVYLSTLVNVCLSICLLLAVPSFDFRSLRLFVCRAAPAAAERFIPNQRSLGAILSLSAALLAPGTAWEKKKEEHKRMDAVDQWSSKSHRSTEWHVGHNFLTFHETVTMLKVIMKIQRIELVKVERACMVVRKKSGIWQDGQM